MPPVSEISANDLLEALKKHVIFENNKLKGGKNVVWEEVKNALEI